MEETAVEAKKENVDMLIFAEPSFTGYVYYDFFYQLTGSLDGASVNAIRRIAE